MSDTGIYILVIGVPILFFLSGEILPGLERILGLNHEAFFNELHREPVALRERYQKENFDITLKWYSSLEYLFTALVNIFYLSTYIVVGAGIKFANKHSGSPFNLFFSLLLLYGIFLVFLNLFDSNVNWVWILCILSFVAFATLFKEFKGTNSSWNIYYPGYFCLFFSFIFLIAKFLSKKKFFFNPQAGRIILARNNFFQDASWADFKDMLAITYRSTGGIYWKKPDYVTSVGDRGLTPEAGWFYQSLLIFKDRREIDLEPWLNSQKGDKDKFLKNLSQFFEIPFYKPYSGCEPGVEMKDGTHNLVFKEKELPNVLYLLLRNIILFLPHLCFCALTILLIQKVCQWVF
ncbi:hypothetical protein ACFL35_14715 [Candidatus Riflebacteria bacterium]